MHNESLYYAKPFHEPNILENLGALKAICPDNPKREHNVEIITTATESKIKEETQKTESALDAIGKIAETSGFDKIEKTSTEEGDLRKDLEATLAYFSNNISKIAGYPISPKVESTGKVINTLTKDTLAFNDVVSAISYFLANDYEIPLNQDAWEKLAEFTKKIEPHIKIAELANTEITKLQNAKESIEGLYLDDFIEAIDQLCAHLEKIEPLEASVAQLHNLIKTANQMYPNKKLDEKITSSFLKLTQRKQSLPSKLRQELNMFFVTEEALIMKLIGTQFSKKEFIQKEFIRYEDFLSELFNYSPHEIGVIRRFNWNNVKEYMNSIKATHDGIDTGDIEKIHELAMQGLLPKELFGFRSRYSKHQNNNLFRQSLLHGYSDVTIKSEIGNKDRELQTTPVAEIPEAMNHLVTKANESITGNLPKRLFEIQLALLAEDYAKIHPHYDGNGTCAVFFMEACMAARGDYELQETYALGLTPRIKETLRHNYIALGHLAVATVLHDITGKVITKRKEEKQ